MTTNGGPDFIPEPDNVETSPLFDDSFESPFGGPKKPHPKFVAYCKEEFEKVTNPRFFGSKVLIHYLLGNNNQRFGVLIAYKDGDAIRFGWSVCQTHLDKWNKFVGFHYAYKKSQKEVRRIPASFFDTFDWFVARSLRYFKVEPNELKSNVGEVITP
jgi:hypothetical protein